MNKGFLDKLYLVLLVVVLGGIVLQAPISVALGSLFPHLNLLIKSWAEILLVVVSLIAMWLLYKKQQFGLLKNKLFIVIGAYVLLHLVMLIFLWQGLTPSLAGLAIDLRYIDAFVLAYIAMKLYPEWRDTFIKTAVWGAVVVLGFAVLQVFVLPHDILKYLGYGKSTIEPYLTVDLNSAFVRINSTLRGPNPVGAYAVLALGGVLTFVLEGRHKRSRKLAWGIAGVAAAGLIALWASYSRSADLALIVTLLVAIGIYLRRRVVALSVVGLVVVVIGSIYALNITGHGTFIDNVVLHDNPSTGAAISSDEGHASSLQEATKQALRQPFGAGVGSTGSASLLGDSPQIIENQYLFTAHEVGWVGLLLFAIIFVWILDGLWQQRKNWLAAALFAGGIGMAVIGLLLPVWVDDTVSIVWWMLAGIVLGGKNDRA